MDVYGISGFNPTISLINALYPTTRVTSASSLGPVLPVSSSYASISNLGRLLTATDALDAAAAELAAPDAFAALSTASSKESVATGTANASGTLSLDVRLRGAGLRALPALYASRGEWSGYGNVSADLANQQFMANLTSTMQTHSSLLESLISQSNALSRNLA